LRFFFFRFKTRTGITENVSTPRHKTHPVIIKIFLDFLRFFFRFKTRTGITENVNTPRHKTHPVIIKIF
jgi:hypothetical protein